MNQISFDKLKENCVREFCTNNTRMSGSISAASMAGEMAVARLIDLKENGKPKAVRQLVKEIEDDCVLTIERTDIRNLKPLIDLCPKVVPEWIKSGNYAIDFNGEKWMLIKKGINF